jgi:hypothetical protein
VPVTTLPNIVAAILTALAADLGTFDLSGDDQVKEGTYTDPPTGSERCFACLPPAELVSSEPHGQPVAYYLETWRQTIRAWAPSTASTADSKASTSRQLVAQIEQVLDRARLNDYPAATVPIWACATWVVSGAKQNPSAANAALTWAHVELTVTFSFPRPAGRGA